MESEHEDTGNQRYLLELYGVLIVFIAGSCVSENFGIVRLESAAGTAGGGMPQGTAV